MLSIGSLCVGSFYSFIFPPYNRSPEKWRFLALKSLLLPQFSTYSHRTGFIVKRKQGARMENWNQDLPERYSKFCGLYIKFRDHGKWPWTWWGPWKRQGHWPHPPGHQKWRKACINTCKHILKFLNCVLLRVPINNNNYEQPIALYVIIPAKNTFTNQYGVV